MCTEVSPPMILTRETTRVLIRFKQVHFPPQSWVFNAYHNLCYKLFLYVSIQSFFLRYFVVLCFSAGVLQTIFHAMISNRKKTKRLMWCNPYAKATHALLSVHSLIFFLQSNQVKRTPQDSINELIIWKMNPLVVPVAWISSDYFESLLLPQ